MKPAHADARRPTLSGLLSGVRRVVASLPQFPPSAATAFALNVVLNEVVAGPELDPARGKLVRVEISDLGLAMCYRVHEGGVAAAASDMPDVTITAEAAAYWSLVTGKEDADMLFFSRRLVMTGDTELGLLIRNTLDAIDRPRVLRMRVPSPRELVRALRHTFDAPRSGTREPPH